MVTISFLRQLVIFATDGGSPGQVCRLIFVSVVEYSSIKTRVELGTNFWVKVLALRWVA